MTTDQDLRRLLDLAAQAYEPPAQGATRLLQQTRSHKQARPTKRLKGPAFRRPWTVALAAASVIGVLVALSIGLHPGVGGRTSSGNVSSPESASSGGAPSGSASSGSAPSGTASRAGTKGAQSAAPAPGTQGTKTIGPHASTRVVQTAQIAMAVPRGQVASALDRLSSIAGGLGGYVAQSRSDQGSGTPSGTTSLRVPVAAFAAASTQARGLGRVMSASSQAQDVTGDYVDLSARISALQQTRATYLTLLSKASSIGDTLSVQQQVQDVQTQIEQLQGQQKLLADTSDLATLSVTVTEAGAAPTAGASTSGFGAALHRAVNGFAGGLQALIAISGPVLLVALVFAALAFIGRLCYRRLQRRLL